MKRIIAVAVSVIILMSVFALSGCSSAQNPNNEYVRIHIRADSDSDFDQAVKLEVRDSLVAYLAVILEDAESAAEAKLLIAARLDDIEKIADGVLDKNLCGYTSNAKLQKERFPTKDYGSLTLEAGVYDALIVNLGSGEGANWWCVAFPPLCFVPSDNVEYKSKILEIIQKYKDKNNG